MTGHKGAKGVAGDPVSESYIQKCNIQKHLEIANAFVVDSTSYTNFMLGEYLKESRNAIY